MIIKYIIVVFVRILSNHVSDACLSCCYLSNQHDTMSTITIYVKCNFKTPLEQCTVILHEFWNQIDLFDYDNHSSNQIQQSKKKRTKSFIIHKGQDKIFNQFWAEMRKIYCKGNSGRYGVLEPGGSCGDKILNEF